MYFTNITTKAPALAIVAMTASHFAFRVAAAPVTPSQADYLRNGQDAQALNKQFESVTVQDPCNAGEKACIGRNFAVCSPENDWEVDPCPESLQCFAVPTKAGTTISCTTPDDAQARIADTGATGGINGDSPNDDHNSNEDGGDKDSSTLVATASTSVVETDTSTYLPTVTSTLAASDIPEFSIPLGDAFSETLSTTTTDTATATSTVSGTETTDFPTATTASTTCSTATVTDTSDSSGAISTSAASSAASGRFTTRLTTTVIVTPTECSTTGVSESSMAQGTATAPSLVTFTTHPFSPIPVSTSTSASDDTISSSAGYVIGSTSSSEAPVVTTSPTQSVSFITQTGTQSFPVGGTIGFITLSDLPTESAPSSTTSDAPAYSYPSDVPAYSYSSDAPAYSGSSDAPAYSGSSDAPASSLSSEPSIPPMGAAPTPAVIVLPPHFTPA